MLRILIPMFILNGIGLYLLLADLLGVPTFATTKAVITATRRGSLNRGAKQSKSVEAILFDLAVHLSKRIKMDAYKKQKLASTLRSAGITLSPEIYFAKAIVKGGVVILTRTLALLIFPILFPVALLLGIAIFFREYKRAGEIVRKKRDAIEGELPRFVNTITQELQASRDILSMLQSYQKHAGPAFRTELDITIADMKSGSLETALTRLESRMGSASLSDVVRGLIAVIRGDNGIVYFQMLAHDLKLLEIQKLKLIAMKRPGKIKKYSFYMLMCFLLMYLVIITMEAMTAFNKLF